MQLIIYLNNKYKIKSFIYSFLYQIIEVQSLKCVQHAFGSTRGLSPFKSTTPWRKKKKSRYDLCSSLTFFNHKHTRQEHLGEAPLPFKKFNGFSIVETKSGTWEHLSYFFLRCTRGARAGKTLYRGFLTHFEYYDSTHTTLERYGLAYPL